MMLDARALIGKHRSKGVLVDTNLLVLYLVGKVDKRRIPEFKRTQNYTIEDFELLERLISWFGGIVTTPHVLSQTSDLAVPAGKELKAIRECFRAVIEGMREPFDESRLLVNDASFDRLGLADAAIATVGQRGLLVLTDDLDLQVTLASRGTDALNFNHIRPLAWG